MSDDGKTLPMVEHRQGEQSALLFFSVLYAFNAFACAALPFYDNASLQICQDKIWWSYCIRFECQRMRQMAKLVEWKP